jgi:transposase InsO family protein
VVEGETAFEPRSRRPRSSPHRIAPELEDEIVQLRKSLSEEGLDAGPATIQFHLMPGHHAVPSLSTIWRVLKARGFVVAEPHKRPRSSIIRFAAEQPNERWQADITHVQIADRYEVEVLNQLDDHSRLLVGSHARAIFKAADVVACFAQAAGAYGTPASYLTDNGAVFTGAYRGRGWVALERELVERGVALRHSRPYHPQTCGKVERFHQTLKKWLAHQPKARTIAELQGQLDWFRRYYNEVRPHRALSRRTPASAYAARPKAMPSDGPLAIDHYRSRRDIIDKAGKVTLRYNSRLHHIGIGRAHAGKRVRLLVHDLSVRVITEQGELLRQLTLDPTRDYQRLSDDVNYVARQV